MDNPEMNNPEKLSDIHDYLEICLRRKWYIIVPLIVSILVSFGVYKHLPKQAKTRDIFLRPDALAANRIDGKGVIIGPPSVDRYIHARSNSPFFVCALIDTRLGRQLFNRGKLENFVPLEYLLENPGEQRDWKIRLCRHCRDPIGIGDVSDLPRGPALRDAHQPAAVDLRKFKELL